MYLQTKTGRIELKAREFDINGEMKARLERTLQVLPSEHLRTLRYIEIRDRDEYAGGSTNRASHVCPTTLTGRHNYWIMLDIDSFDPLERRINNHPGGLHYTLLHEVGHVVDWATDAFSWIRRNNREGYNLITARNHTSRFTNHAQEKFADTYADLFFYERRENQQRDRCVEAILGSPAFTNLPLFVRLPNGWGLPRADPDRP